ncbi:hypothetical protein GXP75_14885 [Bacillus sp. HU-1818]|uniref:hypothetical protein n=1 Tax=Bacillus sp. HU-1818 TaxID=2704469 RepID=UPI001F5D0332|nr:hypothetical protein [Bacillus sp. HU-1818]MCI3196938.1 hypothetical protein [Bacillus sp. HU-1818]
MFKFGTIGAYKQVRNNPRCKASVELVPGLAVIPNESSGNAFPPGASSSAKGDVYVVGNIIDKPEIRNKVDFKVLKGEYVLAFRLADATGLPIELSSDVVVDYDLLAKDDVLVSAADKSGKWIKAGDDVAEYKVTLKVLEKTTFGGKGLYVTVQA